MNSGRADASTSTDDVKGRPLCLFYFTHPFGVLSPEPPTITTAPPNIARTFVNMEPVPPFWTTSSSQGYDTTSTRPSFDLGNATVHRNPVNLVRNYEVDFQRDSISSSLFSSDMWFSSSAGSRNFEGERRIIPYNRTLPPLQLPVPRDLPLDFDSSDDVWPKKCVHREKFSLPPIEFPISSVSEDLLDDKVSVSGSDYVKRRRRVLGVKKHKRKTRLSSVRRMMTRLMCRSIKDDCPSLDSCCFSIPLRTGVVIISILGVVWAAFFLFAFTSFGSKMLEDYGMPKSYYKPLRYINGLFGVLLCAVNILLFFAAIFESDAFCEVYIWFMVVFWLLYSIIAVGITFGVVKSGAVTFGSTFLLIAFITMIVSIYCIIIVANYRMTLP